MGEEGPMKPSGVSAREPIILGVANVALVEDAARDLEDFSEDSMTLGHSPSWIYPQLPDGLALCVGCWRPITAPQLGVEPCPDARRERLAEYLKQSRCLGARGLPGPDP
jgi:hypothetical protein